MKVMKFGGSSVATPENIRKVMKIASEAKTENTPLGLVVSAFGGVTDELILMAQLAEKGDTAYKNNLAELEQRHLSAIEALIPVNRQSQITAQVKMTLNELEGLLHGIFLIKALSKQSLDLTMSFGERLSAFIISATLNENGIKSDFLDAREVIVTNENFGSAQVNFKVSNQKIQDYFKDKDSIILMTGFIASTETGKTSTLGRGGSDYSVSILGSALNAEVIEIWTDVSGVLTADPRIVSDAFRLDTMTYLEAMEMSHFGAKVIHPPTMIPALEKQIPINIRNTFEPENRGTLITDQQCDQEHIIKGITSISDIALLQVSGSGMVGVVGISMRLFSALAKAKVNVMMISQASSEHSICFAVKPEYAELAKEVIEEEFALEIKAHKIDPIQIETDLSIIAVVGENMRKHSGISGRFFKALGDTHVNVIAIAQGSSELNISAVISSSDTKNAIRAVHEAFFNEDSSDVAVFLLGTGLIGSELMSQMNQIKSPLKLVATANSKVMNFDGEESPMALDQFIDKMVEHSSSRKIFVDCSSNQSVADAYAKIMKSGVSIVTPNKKANSGSISDYETLSGLESKEVKFLYETNVGAGLPVLSTLNDLIRTGDQVQKIEAVLSGTLSYLFNTYDGQTPFSELVKSAQEKGYTEPDPRDDLNGLDVARKILILARESGFQMELNDVSVKSLISEESMNADSIDAFYEALKEQDSDYAQQFEAAKKDAKVLRFIASLEKGKATVELKAVDASHPFYSLSGSDNIISFCTHRYQNTPLVIKGPGAGAAVTAAGVLSDLLKVSDSLTTLSHDSKTIFRRNTRSHRDGGAKLPSPTRKPSVVSS